MGIEAKHAYRFGYLKSEQWAAVRLEAMAREGSKCQICGQEDIHNDAHHIWYPEHIYNTTAHQLVILCRPCHDFIHIMVPECKTSNESEGWDNWNKFSKAIRTWRLSKLHYFGNSDGIKVTTPKMLRLRCDELTAQLHNIESNGSTKDLASLNFLAKIQRRIEKHLTDMGHTIKT